MKSENMLGESVRLNDNEIRDITKLLEAGKPLPDRYRFLLFDDKREVELVWNGKTNEICNIVLPFQTIEQVDEPRTEKAMESQLALFDPQTGRQLKGWNNKLIWGDNKLILSSLKNGPMREEIEAQGGIKLIYIDPPFDVGADFSMNIEIGDDTFTKKPGILEEIAYRDTWGKGADSFIAMIYERLVLMHDLLAEDGSIYVHCDWRVNSYIRLVLDEVFGKERFVNQIEWGYKTGGIPESVGFSKKHDHILFYAQSMAPIFNRLLQKSYVPTLPEPHTNSGRRLGVQRDDVCELCGNGSPGQKYRMVIARDIWDDISSLFRNDIQVTGYATQKPEALLERIINASSNEGDLVADFFCGSGTTAAVAEKLGRKWIVSDLGKFAIHTTRKRMIGVQRQLKADGKNYRAFEILNLGKYERQHYIGVNPNLQPEQQQTQIAAKSKEYQDLILKAYAAQPVKQSAAFHGKKSGRMVAIGPINLPVTRLFVEEIILECRKNLFTRADILAFEFEMGLFPQIMDEAKNKGVNLEMKYIPAEVFDKRAVEKNQVVFHDVSFIEVKPHITKGKKGKPATVAVELTDFSVHYSQDSITNAEQSLKNGKSKIIAVDGQIVRISKDKTGKPSKQTLTEHWLDWIDYWAVDFDFESKREIIRVKNNDTGKTEEQWSGDYIFENEWQSFRTKKDRTIELKSVRYECLPGRRKIAVKVVDIFGNDTMKILEVGV